MRYNSLARWASLLVVAAGLGGCAGDEARYASIPSPAWSLPMPDRAGSQPREPLQQCVPYAREHSDVKIYGDAWTWWDQAAGKYAENQLPQSGAVMVLTGYAGPERGHVAVVRQIVSSRQIRVDHANWLDDGSVYLDDPVEDVSADNDWSQVRVFNVRTGSWGGKVYTVRGFIGGADGNQAPEVAPDPLGDLMARADSKKFDR
jgi:surface antigen